MKIDRIRVDGFGRLSDFDTGQESLERLVVVLGPNEAGKSTLFAFLTTALYGFQPASRERNPHVPWGTEEARGGISLRLDGDGCADIERWLRSQPGGKLKVDGGGSDLRNQPLPWVEHVPRTVFRQVFAITLGELAGLDGETWARIQDKVVGSMGASDLRPARAVAEELEREASEIWRPNRRGNQRLRALHAELRQLRTRRSAAEARDRQIRALILEREAVRDRLTRARESRHHDRVQVDRTQALLPVKKQLDRIRSLRARGGDRSVVDGFPFDPQGRLAELEAEDTRVEQRIRAVDDDLAERAAAIAELDEGALELIRRRDDIARLAAESAGCAPERSRVLELETTISELEDRLDEVSTEVLSRPWRDVDPQVILELSIPALRQRLEAEPASEPRVPVAMQRPVAAVSVIAGLAALVWGLVTVMLPVAVLGGALLGAGLVGLLLLGRARGRPAAPERRTLFGEIPIRDDHLTDPGLTVLDRLESLQTALREHARSTRSRENASRRIAGVDQLARTLARSLGTEDDGDAGSISYALDRALRRAERLHDEVGAAERESRRLWLERDALTESLDNTAPEIARIRAAASALGAGDVGRGLEEAQVRLEALARADQLEDELERAHPDLEDLIAQIEKAGVFERLWTVDDRELARARSRIEAAEEEIETLLKKGEALEREADHLRELETVDAVDGEIASLEESGHRLAVERDRSWVFAQLLREADRRFREEHQPDLVRRASAYLDHLTGGRYDRMLVDETRAGDLFRLVGPGLPAPVALAPPISTGTLEQAYLSLRLAIVDHLDQGGERLPLFIDEVFVNWDEDRRRRGLKVLAGISASRQVFVFTCHPAVAEELERRGGKVLGLRPGA